LYTAGVLDLVRDSRKEIEFNLVIESYAPQYAQKVRDFFTLLDLTMPTDDAKDLLIPIYFGVKIGSFWGIPSEHAQQWTWLKSWKHPSKFH